MNESYDLVVEAEPDPHDLALLEERLAADAVAAAGVGDEQEFGIFVRDDRGRGGRRCFRQHLGRAAARCTQCGSTIERGDVDSGGPLMAETEAEARRRGCRLVDGPHL